MNWSKEILIILPEIFYKYIDQNSEISFVFIPANIWTTLMMQHQSEEKSLSFPAYTHEPLYHVGQQEIQALQLRVTLKWLFQELFDTLQYLQWRQLQTGKNKLIYWFFWSLSYSWIIFILSFHALMDKIPFSRCKEGSELLHIRPIKKTMLFCRSILVL